MSANPLTSTLAALLESAASAALALDADARKEIAGLDGQILALELTTLPSLPKLALRINCHGEGGPANRAGDGGSLTIMADTPHNLSPPNTIVRGDIADVMSALWSDELPRGITIEGDEQLLRAMQRCFRELSPAWRERVDMLVGRFANSNASSGGQILQDVLGQAELAFDTLRHTLGGAFDNTREQAHSTADKFWAKEDEVEDFARRLENLQLDIDRLSAQVRHLSAKTDS